jgi:hypothetical protein
MTHSCSSSNLKRKKGTSAPQTESGLLCALKVAASFAEARASGGGTSDLWFSRGRDFCVSEFAGLTTLSGSSACSQPSRVMYRPSHFFASRSKKGARKGGARTLTVCDRSHVARGMHLRGSRQRVLQSGGERLIASHAVNFTFGIRVVHP